MTLNQRGRWFLTALSGLEGIGPVSNPAMYAINGISLTRLLDCLKKTVTTEAKDETLANMLTFVTPVRFCARSDYSGPV